MRPANIRHREKRGRVRRPRRTDPTTSDALWVDLVAKPPRPTYLIKKPPLSTPGSPDSLTFLLCCPITSLQAFRDGRACEGCSSARAPISPLGSQSPSRATRGRGRRTLSARPWSCRPPPTPHSPLLLFLLSHLRSSL